MQDISLGTDQPFFHYKNPDQPISGQIVIVQSIFLNRAGAIGEIKIDGINDENILWYKDAEGIEYSIINALDTKVGVGPNYLAIIKNGQIDTLRAPRIQNVKIGLENLSEWGIEEEELSLPDAPDFNSLVRYVLSTQSIITLGVNKNSPVINIRGYMTSINHDGNREVEILIYHPNISGGMMPIIENYFHQKREQFPGIKCNIDKYSLSTQEAPYYTFETIGGYEGFEKLLAKMTNSKDKRTYSDLISVFYTEPYYNWSLGEEFVSFHFQYEASKKLLKRIIEQNSCIGEGEYEKAFRQPPYFEQLFDIDEDILNTFGAKDYNLLEKWCKMASEKRNKSTGHTYIEYLDYPAGHPNLFVICSFIALQIFSVIYLLHNILELPEKRTGYITELPSFKTARENLIKLIILQNYFDVIEKLEEYNFDFHEDNIEGPKLACSKCDYAIKFKLDPSSHFYNITNPLTGTIEYPKFFDGNQRIEILAVEHSSTH